jgi:DNA-binding NtrC family response regulator
MREEASGSAIEGTSVGPVAIVDDDATTRGLMRRWLQAEGYEVIEFDCGAKVLSGLPGDVSVVCLDLGLDDMPGINVLKHLRARNPDVPIIVATARRELETAVDCMRAGAYDYLDKPLDKTKLAESVRRAMERCRLAASMRTARAEMGEKSAARAIIGRSAPMQEMVRQIDRVLESDVSVCVFGESGTGKELVASAIHGGGRRRRGPLVPVNCGAIPLSLQESELFGHERGAFTGAAGAHKGRFEQANGGTLFLDELGEMSPSTQASLLRALQEKTIRRVGGTSDIPVNVRVVCATHRDLSAEVKAGRFREDLYFRLVVYPIRVPALRERLDDVPLLVGHFLSRLSADVGRDIRRISADALSALNSYMWPGNVRELQNVVHRAMLACDGDEIGLSHLPPELRARVLPSIPAPAPAATRISAQEEPILPLAELERRAIIRALQASGGSVGKAARMLGMGRATLYRRLAAFGITETAEA